ncbi:response regulator transcription factor [Azospirillum thermophilum]|uniref:Response regulator n=1 Tax=Azospirillum thermophilum TaxID=2202148 RepID=A0A2S2CWL3_9PROT|nr:response regulator [Azospirillum thermophilum]AWK88866.1 response regulator [Azospirillum thermophilum]
MARILVIDDVPSFTALLKVVLEGRGHSVTERHDGESGLAEAQQGGYELVMIDMMMPGLDGIECVRRLRTLGPPLTIIAMSGGTDRFPAAYSLKLSEMHGADRLLFKPFDNAELVATVEEVLAERAT